MYILLECINYGTLSPNLPVNKEINENYTDEKILWESNDFKTILNKYYEYIKNTSYKVLKNNTELLTYYKVIKEDGEYYSNLSFAKTLYNMLFVKPIINKLMDCDIEFELIRKDDQIDLAFSLGNNVYVLNIKDTLEEDNLEVLESTFKNKDTELFINSYRIKNAYDADKFLDILNQKIKENLAVLTP